MEKEDRKEPLDFEGNAPHNEEEPVKLSASFLERRRRRFSFHGDGIGAWQNLHGLEFPDAPIPDQIAMEEDWNAAIEEAEEIVDEDFLV
ncbi:MAG: hypothetical protein GX081_00250 [Firmicutes bacterium]|nr:hypothetical protein [Bacillota bacterium]